MINSKESAQKSVVYSFQGRWLEALKDGRIRVFFRKNRPTTCPEKVFFYVGTPVKELIGFAKLEKIETVDLLKALNLREDGAISDIELKNYIGTKSKVYAIWVGSPQIFKSPRSLYFLNEKFGFHPPQSFLNLDHYMESELIRSGAQ